MRNRRILRHPRSGFGVAESTITSSLPVFDHSGRAVRVVEYADKIAELEEEMDFTCPYYDVNASGLSNLVIEEDDNDADGYNLEMQICKVSDSPEFALYFKPKLALPSVDDIKALAGKWVDDDNSLYVFGVFVRADGVILVAKDSVQADKVEFEKFLAYCKNFMANFWYYACPQLPIKMPRILLARGEIQQFLKDSGIDLNDPSELSDDARCMLFGLDS